VISPGQALRLAHIGWVLARHGLDELLLDTPLFRPVRFLHYFMWWRWLRVPGSRGERIRRALEDLGPIFVKFGQILSTRRDLLASDIADELTRLQDRVPPFAGHLSRAIVEKAYRKPIEEVFASFDEQPIASASIAQVHGATLHDGRKVVVKVVRPDIAPVIKRDLSLMYIVAELLQNYWSEGKRLRPIEVISEFEKTILDELDLLREAANASQLKRNFADSPILYIPEVYWPYCRSSVMVMERISGIPVGQVEVLRAAGIDMKLLAERGVEIFFTQVFRHNFFHADMHPGNIFVSPEGRYIAVDFGIVGTLAPEDKNYLAENLLAFFKRDYYRVAQLHVESGWVPAGTRVDEFEAAIRTVCEPIFERPLADISFGQLLLRLFQTARRFHMEVQPQLVLLQKTLLNIEGLGRDLYPALDLWTTAKPFLERWMREQLGTQAFMGRLKNEVPRWGEKLPEIPGLIFDLLHKTKAGQLEVQFSVNELKAIRGEVREANRRTIAAVVGAALVISSAIINGLGDHSSVMLGALTWLVGAVGLLFFIRAWPAPP